MIEKGKFKLTDTVVNLRMRCKEMSRLATILTRAPQEHNSAPSCQGLLFLTSIPARETTSFNINYYFLQSRQTLNFNICFLFLPCVAGTCSIIHVNLKYWPHLSFKTIIKIMYKMSKQAVFEIQTLYRRQH